MANNRCFSCTLPLTLPFPTRIPSSSLLYPSLTPTLSRSPYLSLTPRSPPLPFNYPPLPFPYTLPYLSLTPPLPLAVRTLCVGLQIECPFPLVEVRLVAHIRACLSSASRRTSGFDVIPRRSLLRWGERTWWRDALQEECRDSVMITHRSDHRTSGHVLAAIRVEILMTQLGVGKQINFLKFKFKLLSVIFMLLNALQRWSWDTLFFFFFLQKKD